jgi:hypothetical protein
MENSVLEASQQQTRASDRWATRFGRRSSANANADRSLLPSLVQ